MKDKVRINIAIQEDIISCRNASVCLLEGRETLQDMGYHQAYHFIGDSGCIIRSFYKPSGTILVEDNGEDIIVTFFFMPSADEIGAVLRSLEEEDRSDRRLGQINIYI